MTPISKGGSVLSLADDLLLKVGFSVAFPNLEGDCLSVDDLDPGLADGFHRNMGFSIAFPNLSSSNPRSVTLHSAEGGALLTNLGSTARLAEGGRLLAPESADKICLSAIGLAGSDKTPLSSRPTTANIRLMASGVWATSSIEETRQNQRLEMTRSAETRKATTQSEETRLAMTRSAEGCLAECRVWVFARARRGMNQSQNRQMVTPDSTHESHLSELSVGS